MKWIRENLKWIAAALAALFVVAWLAHDRKPAPQVNQTVVATPSPEVKDSPKEAAPPLKKPLMVYSGGEKLKEKIGLPPEVVKDEAEQVIASSKIDCEQPVTITTTTNTDTGESKTFVRADPPPLLAWDDHGGIGMYAVLNNGSPGVMLQVNQGLFRVGKVHVGAFAGMTQPTQTIARPDSFAGLGAEYRW
jgi:hypothetical protein